VRFEDAGTGAYLVLSVMDSATEMYIP
jgi:hypothetical protein